MSQEIQPMIVPPVSATGLAFWVGSDKVDWLILSLKVIP
jgi:hypothetical protein